MIWNWWATEAPSNSEILWNMNFCSLQISEIVLFQKYNGQNFLQRYISTNSFYLIQQLLASAAWSWQKWFPLIPLAVGTATTNRSGSILHRLAHTLSISLVYHHLQSTKPSAWHGTMETLSMIKLHSQGMPSFNGEKEKPELRCLESYIIYIYNNNKISIMCTYIGISYKLSSVRINYSHHFAKVLTFKWNKSS